MYIYSLLYRQLEEVDKALEVHRETERVLHEKVVNANSSFSRYTVNYDVAVTGNCEAFDCQHNMWLAVISSLHSDVENS